MISDEMIPRQFEHDGCSWLVTDKKQNNMFRLIAMPIFGTGKIANGGKPKWFSDAEISEILATKEST